MKKLAGWYLADWWKIMARPIYFYTFMEKGDLNDKPFSFLLVTSWILAIFITAAVYIISISQMLLQLISGIYGVKLLIVLPVFIIMIIIFFIMIFLIVLSVTTVGLIALSVIVARMLAYIAAKFGGAGDVAEMIRSAYYSSAVALGLVFLPVLACAAKVKALSYANFAAGVNIILSVIIFYYWGLWSIALRKVFKISRTKAVLATLIVIILMILLQMFVSVKVIPKLERWIS